MTSRRHNQTEDLSWKFRMNYFWGVAHMARYRCRACLKEGNFVYDSRRHECPSCGSSDVQMALEISELDDDDLLIEALQNLNEGESDESQ